MNGIEILSIQVHPLGNIDIKNQSKRPTSTVWIGNHEKKSYIHSIQIPIVCIILASITIFSSSSYSKDCPPRTRKSNYSIPLTSFTVLPSTPVSTILVTVLARLSIVSHTGLSLNRPISKGTSGPSHAVICRWSRNSSSVLGWTRALNGPRCTTSQLTKAPNWWGVKSATSNIPGACGPCGLVCKGYILSSGTIFRPSVYADVTIRGWDWGGTYIPIGSASISPLHSLLGTRRAAAFSVNAWGSGTWRGNYRIEVYVHVEPG